MIDPTAYPILYVDDEKGNRVVLEHNFRNQFSLITAESGEKALDILQHQHIAVLLTDQRMPRMTGVDLAERVEQINPDIVRIILTAYGDINEAIDAINRGKVHRFLQKPWSPEWLRAVLLESIQTYHDRQLSRQLQLQIAQLDRNSTLAFVTMGLVHDLRRPSQTLHHNLAHLDDLHQQLHAILPPEHPYQNVLLQLQEIQQDIRIDANNIQRLLQTFIKTIGPLEHNPTTVFDAVEVMQDALLLIKTTIIRQAKLTVSAPDHPVYLHGSPQQFLQLINNLLTNATQALYKEGWNDNIIHLSLQETPTQQIELLVSDTGIGIEPETLPHIFEFFFTTKGEAGCGLGLAICKKVIDDMQGTIEVNSQPNQGTTFRILFPKTQVS